MRYLLAIVLPPVVFFTMGKPLQGVLNLILMVTLIGWPIAAIWAIVTVNSYHGDMNRKRVVEAMDRQTAELQRQAEIQPPQ
ncbi:MAG: YqaE/Pmp3 family membrane protein [Planctomycetota bacterium]